MLLSHLLTVLQTKNLGGSTIILRICHAPERVVKRSTLVHTDTRAIFTVKAKGIEDLIEPVVPVTTAAWKDLHTT